MRNVHSPTVTLVTECYNLAEGQSEDSFAGALAEVDRIGRQNANVDVVVVDPTPQNISAPIVARLHPDLKVMHLPGQSCDSQKNSVSRASKSDFVVFLDGECRPKRDDWLEQILAPFADPEIPAVSGRTIYDDDSVTDNAMSVLDFGFLFHQPRDALGCYLLNNIAFRRESILRIPIPDDGILRCYCYKHAQFFQRAGIPIRYQPGAIVLHQLPDIRKERLRRGYDYVAALWADPALGETAWLDPGEDFVSSILDQNFELACMRLKIAPPELGISAGNAVEETREVKRLMAIDAEGILKALELGEADGSNSRARETHFALRETAPAVPT